MTELYKDPLVRITTSEEPCTKGDIDIFPVEEKIKIEELSDDTIKHLFFSGSYAATALFELLGAHGTNIILSDLDSKPKMEIVARKENDGLNFQWNPTKGDPGQLKDLAKQIKDQIDMDDWKEKNPDSSSTPKQVEKKETVLREEEGKTNYLLKSLERRPW